MKNFILICLFIFIVLFHRMDTSNNRMKIKPIRTYEYMETKEPISLPVEGGYSILIIQDFETTPYVYTGSTMALSYTG
jgi:hypothetical protein